MKSKYLLLELLACLFFVLPTKSYSISFDQNNITVGNVNNWMVVGTFLTAVALLT